MLFPTFQTFDELIELAEKGDRKRVDLLVRDTAGSDYNQASSDSMVSSFGKAAKILAQKTGKENEQKEVELMSDVCLLQVRASARRTLPAVCSTSSPIR
jgi:pantothenate kinase